MGLAALSPGQRDCAEWLAEADAACYAAKREGRADRSAGAANTAAAAGARLKLVDAA
jgi:GGDEF domain-containing protein